MNWWLSGERYEGEWRDDDPHGRGSYYWFEGKGESRIIKTIYRGEWVVGKRNGVGMFLYGSGSRIEGYFTNNLKNGNCFATDEFGESHL